MKYTNFLILFFTSLFLVFEGFSQPSRPGQCEEFPTLTDSTHSFNWNIENQDWDLISVQINTYNSIGRITLLESFDAKTRLPLTKTVYYYSTGSKLKETYSYRWFDNQWQNVTNVKYSSEPDGSKSYETVYNWVNNAWLLQNNRINYLDNGRLSHYLYQLVNRATGEFYDYGNYYLSYTGFGKIDEWYGERISDGQILFRRYHFYDDNQRITERYIHTLIRGELVLDVRNLYYHDIYGLHRETISQKPVEEGWVNTTRSIIYRRIDNAKKVTVCLNGRSLCVAKQAIPGLLRAGAILGACPVTVPQTRGIAKEQADNKLNKDSSISFYPNPAAESVNVFAGDSFSRVELINSNGQTVRSFSLQNGDLTVIERNGLPSGIYFLRFVGQEEVKTEKVIFK